MTNYNRKKFGPQYVTEFEILGPPLISGTAEGRNLKFGIWIDYDKYKLAGDKLLPTAALPGSGAALYFGTLAILFLEGVKLGT